MVWLAAGLVALVVLHELAVYVLARMLGAEPRRHVAIVAVRGRRRGALALAGGIVVGYLVVAAIALVLFLAHGLATGRGRYAVGDVKPGFDASGKLVAGDVVVAIDGTDLWYPQTNLVERVNAKGGAPVTLTVERDHARRDVTIQPTLTEHRWLIGFAVAYQPETVRDLGAVLPAALELPALQVRQFGGEAARPLQSSGDPGGPKRIVDEIENVRDANDVRWMMRAIVVAFLALVVLDLVRAAMLLRSRRP